METDSDSTYDSSPNNMTYNSWLYSFTNKNTNKCSLQLLNSDCYSFMLFMRKNHLVESALSMSRTYIASIYNRSRLCSIGNQQKATDSPNRDETDEGVHGMGNIFEPIWNGNFNVSYVNGLLCNKHNLMEAFKNLNLPECTEDKYNQLFYEFENYIIKLFSIHPTLGSCSRGGYMEDDGSTINASLNYIKLYESTMYLLSQRLHHHFYLALFILIVLLRNARRLLFHYKTDLALLEFMLIMIDGIHMCQNHLYNTFLSDKKIFRNSPFNRYMKMFMNKDLNADHDAKTDVSITKSLEVIKVYNDQCNNCRNEIHSICKNEKLKSESDSVYEGERGGHNSTSFDANDSSSTDDGYRHDTVRNGGNSCQYSSRSSGRGGHYSSGSGGNMVIKGINSGRHGNRIVSSISKSYDVTIDSRYDTENYDNMSDTNTKYTDSSYGLEDVCGHRNDYEDDQLSTSSFANELYIMCRNVYPRITKRDEYFDSSLDYDKSEISHNLFLNVIMDTHISNWISKLCKLANLCCKIGNRPVLFEKKYFKTMRDPNDGVMPILCSKLYTNLSALRTNTVKKVSYKKRKTKNEVHQPKRSKRSKKKQDVEEQLYQEYLEYMEKIRQYHKEEEEVPDRKQERSREKAGQKTPRGERQTQRSHRTPRGQLSQRHQKQLTQKEKRSETSRSSESSSASGAVTPVKTPGKVPKNISPVKKTNGSMVKSKKSSLKSGEPKKSKYQKWNFEEVELFIKALNIYGDGNWRHIEKTYFNGKKSQSQLKDKWVNLVKFGHIKKVEILRENGTISRLWVPVESPASHRFPNTKKQK